MDLGKYSMGVGDRFGRQGCAQLAALVEAGRLGVEIVPVWNKSHREHVIIGSRPDDVRIEADEAVAKLGWKGSYHVDADHINLKNVETFIGPSDFFTLDVAEFIGRPADEQNVRAFVDKTGKYVGTLEIEGIEPAVEVSRALIEQIACKYLSAVRHAGAIYRRITSAIGGDSFIVEVSMDEADQPQSPVELFFILAAIADEGVPAQTIAPKFVGRFNKGVDYVGDAAQFEEQFNADLAVIAMAVGEFDLPENLKLSVHSGSDKFSIYGAMARAIGTRDARLHVKTAGTTWLEELIGLASAGGEGLTIARDIYERSYRRFDKLAKPYSTVIDIDPARLPTPEQVNGWTSEEYAGALRHDPSCQTYNLHLRQLLHVAYKVAAEMGQTYLDALDCHHEIIGRNVKDNILERHIKRIFIPQT